MLKARFLDPLFLIILLLLYSSPLFAETDNIIPRYELAISFDLQNSLMAGTAHVSVPPEKEGTFSLANIEVTGILLHREGEETLTMKIPENNLLVIPQSKGWQEVFISYRKVVNNSPHNRIAQDGIVLTNSWYPQPNEEAYFTLKAALPKGFTALSESDSFTRSLPPQDTFHLSRPLSAIHFVAGPYTINRLKVRDGFYIYALFFQKDLAAEYLESTRSYIQRYEKEIGPFPYNFYAIVENHLPTGYGLPTFTLLGKSILRLPFIKDTSLGHEVLHSWFGNSVSVADGSGNWCEGLTSYLADWTYRFEKGQDVAVRQENLQKYLNYTQHEAVISLGEFSSASHLQPMANAIRAVGYSRGAMFFHELSELLTRDTFQKGVRHFYFRNVHQAASWKDLQKSMEEVSGKDLSLFFNERLSRKDIPDISIENLTTASVNKGTQLNFTLIQKTAKPFHFKALFEITTVNKPLRFTQEISELKTAITLTLPTPPLALTFDPDFDMLRRLTPEEAPVKWSNFLGSNKKFIILASNEEREIYKPLLDNYRKQEWKVTTASQVKSKDLLGADLLFLGVNNRISRSLFSLPNHAKQGFTLEVRSNPLDPTHTAVLISSSAKAQTAMVTHRLKHYGKYNFLHFLDGQIQTKTEPPFQSGQKIILDELPMGMATTDLSSFANTMDKISGNRVVYIGETHTSASDHRLQFRIIQELYARNPNLVIGMEMFPKSSQPALDEYLLHDSDMDERTFLKQSHYFEVWRYDWRFFRDIFTFARKHKIPILGLNLERSIVSHVFKKGSTDGLDQEIIDSLPKDRDLSIHGYQQRLSRMHGFHIQGGHGSGMMSGFIQAQALWDETMAENISNFLTQNPKSQMVVLAGSQHTRKDSGIPPRVARRLDIPQASVINLQKDNVPPDAANQADYIFMSPEYTLPALAKIGVVLDTITLDSKNYLQITQLSPHGKAEEAGLEVKDIILTIDGYPIHEMEDIQIAMIDAKAGSKVPLDIRRKKEDDSSEEMSVEVELFTPKNKPHP